MDFRIRCLLSLVLLATAIDAAKNTKVMLGEKAYSKGSLDSARNYFEQAIQEGDETGEPRLYIGLILESRRQYAESIQYFRAAAQRPMRPKFKKVAYWKMVILCRQAKQYAESLRYAERLQEMGVKSELFEKIRAEAENAPGRRDYKGYPHIAKARALEQTLAERREKGEDYADLVELVHSIIENYNLAITEDAHWKENRAKIARYHEHLKEHREAEITYRLIWQDEADPGAAYKLGTFSRRKGKYNEALKYFADALDKPIEDPQLKFYIRLNAAQAHYGLTHFEESFAHAKTARRLAEDIDLKKKTQLSLKRIYCLGAYSVGEIDGQYCKFSQKNESPVFLNLIGMKRALAAKNQNLAAGFAAKIYDKNVVEDDDSDAQFPAYAMADLKSAIGVLFQAERYQAVIDLTDTFQKQLATHEDLAAWRAISYFALKDYEAARGEFAKMHNLSPSQMNLHLLALAHTSDWAAVRAQGRKYLQAAKAREKLEKNFRNLKVYEPLRREPDFEAWLQNSLYQDDASKPKSRDTDLK